MQSKPKKSQRKKPKQMEKQLKLKLQELKKLDFNKAEYEYFIENCNFTDRQKEILDLRRKGKSIVEITFIVHLSESTVFRELKRIKKKILKEI